MKLLIIILLIISNLSISNGISFKNRSNNFKLSKVEILKTLNEDLKHSENNNISKRDREKIIILKNAKKLLGKKYVWGAKVGDYNNFDCSSFVKTLYKEVGINLPRVSREQSKIGKRIPINKLENGDLIFFNTLGNYVSHVGIYIGNNKFIHASSKGGKVQINELSGYYKEKAVFGSRI